MNAPRANIACRAALKRELATQIAACMDYISSVDDLVIQLTGPGEEDPPPASPVP